jgi:hypothetical protein
MHSTVCADRAACFPEVSGFFAPNPISRDGPRNVRDEGHPVRWEPCRKLQ